MYKKLSNYQQEKERRVNARANLSGIDPDVFDIYKEKDKLVDRKRDLELAIKNINDTIFKSQRNFNRTGSRVEHSIYEKWISDRSKFLSEIADIHKKLSALKDLSRKRQSIDEKSFERQFMIMAKELLATPVYDRIVAATIHFIKEKEEEKK